MGVQYSTCALLAAVLTLLLVTTLSWNSTSLTTKTTGHCSTDPLHLRFHHVLQQMPVLKPSLSLFPLDQQAIYSYCTRLPKPNYPPSYHALHQRFLSRARQEEERYGLAVEGHKGKGKSREEYDFFYFLGKLPWVRNVCEIGFNLGHTAFQWLSPQADTRLYSFDIGRHPYTRPMAAFLNTTLFPGRLTMIYGNSSDTVPRAAAAPGQLAGQCDLLYIDGAHTLEASVGDLYNMRSLANPRHHFVIMDDGPVLQSWTEAPWKAWLRGQVDRVVDHVFACAQAKSGFALGVYRPGPRPA